jgi:AcrR family transcriptional regulator
MSETASPVAGLELNRPHRADARRNFDALLSAARKSFAANGVDVPLEDVARDAGVGIGTLYRNFPTRQDLFEAVYLGEIEELCLVARDCAELEPWDAFETWLRRFTSYVTTKMAMMQALNNASQMFKACRGAMIDAALPLYEHAQEAGEIRADVSLDDVLRMIAGVTGGMVEDDDQRERVFVLALDAFRTQRH